MDLIGFSTDFFGLTAYFFYFLFTFFTRVGIGPTDRRILRIPFALAIASGCWFYRLMRASFLRCSAAVFCARGTGVNDFLRGLLLLVTSSYEGRNFDHLFSIFEHHYRVRSSISYSTFSRPVTGVGNGFYVTLSSIFGIYT